MRLKVVRFPEVDGCFGTFFGKKFAGSFPLIDSTLLCIKKLRVDFHRSIFIGRFSTIFTCFHLIPVRWQYQISADICGWWLNRQFYAIQKLLLSLQIAFSEKLLHFREIYRFVFLQTRYQSAIHVFFYPNMPVL